MKSALDGTQGAQADGGGIDGRICKGCGRCVAACRGKVLSLETAGEMGMGKKTARKEEGTCSWCGRCIGACPYGAIRKQT
ncbi:MAG: 4Fe-4S dicluster domain-containing protein [Desulfuromonadales bacterium]|jgi:ferredoxin